MAGAEIIMFIDFVYFGFLSFRSSGLHMLLGAEIHTLFRERR